MRKMKDSGIDWIGIIPESWTVCALKWYSDIIMGQSPASEDITDQGTTLFMQGNREFGVKYPCPTIFCDKCSKHSRVGDILMSVRAPVGAINESDGVYGIGRGLCSIKAEGIDNGFLKYYLMKSIDDLRYYSTGSTFEAITTEILNSFRVAIPPNDEQRSIAEYLEKKYVQINIILEKTRTSIEEYRKLKQAVITQAVTKGVRGDREMKDSGITWIGKVPSEWDLVPFRHVLKERQEKNSPIKSTERLSLSIDLGVTPYSEKTTNLDRFKEDFEQYKLAHKGDLVMNSMNMIVGASGVSDYYGCVSPVYYTYYDEIEDHVTAKYCEYIFRSKSMLRVLYSLGKGIYAIVRGDDRVNTCRLKVSKEDLKSIILPMPSILEQREIVNYLNLKCTELDNLIAKKEQYLSEIENYKKSLIYEYVTGKKEVPCESVD